VLVSVVVAGILTTSLGFGGPLALGVLITCTAIGLVVGLVTWLAMGGLLRRFVVDSRVALAIRAAVSVMAVVAAATIWVSSLGRAAAS
jgi:hypothetical protein